ncbi:hypothetical protein LSH36_1201g00048 [Paralvinella palmiformis]|uniref:Inosine/uridine-preferring nucleoside hydrolase domain-containing protein n=1 Tax=Paralvinella palmiformis TaxID=53620 RepID=A0AAD9ITZ5_9ANNE|nr:hypothetical protein LSH36_1201g00048 [Paralvinella palmiformis]
MSSGKKKLLINTDAGIDDAQAILMALNDPDVEVVAITTSHGNTFEHHVCRNVLRLLKMAGRLDIPVYRGAAKSLIGESITGIYYHGSDGFGDVSDPEAPELTHAESEHAVLAIIRMAKKYSGELILIQLAPATNIALALRIDPDLGRKFKACYMMGGNYEGKGNITNSAEFNFHSDPEAAAVVLEELSCPLYLVCWELCLKHILTWMIYKDSDHYVTADQLVMAIVLDREAVIKKEKLVHCDVEISGKHSRGSMIVSWPSPLQQPPQDKQQRCIHLILEINHDLFSEMLLKATD